ncbi:hypothetical protein AVEN_153864-1 [Araneus ventricosus]|uniref:Uncharacterized protein n=1 Tax=Araneus ventricosus TaxID=182803 RepID=A0A4Y2PPJ2_ARAVE|nr:hypothetical protein AVEN_153864-1 [Araneus ventricosus]
MELSNEDEIYNKDFPDLLQNYDFVLPTDQPSSQQDSNQQQTYAASSLKQDANQPQTQAINKRVYVPPIISDNPTRLIMPTQLCPIHYSEVDIIDCSNFFSMRLPPIQDSWRRERQSVNVGTVLSSGWLII